MLLRRTNRLLIGALLAATLAPLGSSSIAVIIPAISEAVDAEISVVTRLLVGSYLLICVVGQIPAGKLTDRFGSLRILGAGLLLFAIGATSAFMFHDLVILTLARVAMALGVALISPATQALMRIQLPGEKLPTAFGIYGTTMSGAAAAGPLIGGVIASQQHWSWVFAINLPMAILAALFIWSSVSPTDDREATQSEGKLDWQGVLLLFIAVISLQAGLAPDYTVWFLAASVAGFILFMFNEKKHSNPLLAPAVFQHVDYLKSCAATALNNAIMYSLLFQMPILLIVLGITDPAALGYCLLSMTVAMMLAGIVSGRIIRRFGPRVTMTMAQAVCVIAVLMLLRLETATPLVHLLLAMFLVGSSVGVTMPVVQLVGLSCQPAERAGAAAGGLGTTRYLGGVIGIAVMSLMLEGGNLLEIHHRIFMLYMGVVVAQLLIAIAMPKEVEGAA